MALVQWDQSYSVKVNRCDDDHKKLFALINTLHDAMMEGKGADKVQQVVKELSDYTKFHFAAEEAILEKTKYPALAAHRTLHREFEKRVEGLAKDLATRQASSSIPVMQVLTDWLSKHIKQTDQQYSSHVNAAGVS